MKGEINGNVNKPSNKEMEKRTNNIISSKPHIKSRHKTKFNKPKSLNERPRLYQIGLTYLAVCVAKNIPISDRNDFGSK